MYNKERKTRYIDYKESNTVSAENILKRLFDSLEPYEEKYGKDCCDFNETEILNFYKMLGTRSVDVITNHNSRLSLYTDWCTTQGFVGDGQNHYRTLNKWNFEACVNVLGVKFLKFDREELLDKIKDLPNPRDAFVLLYCFEVGAKEYNKIFTEMEMDWFEGNTLHLPDRDVQVSNELISYAEKADKEQLLYTMKPGGANRVIPMEETGKIVKWKKSDREGRVVFHDVVTIITKAVDYVGLPKLRAKEIAIMGQIEMLKKIGEENGKTIEQVVLTPELFNIMKKQYGETERPNSYLRRMKAYIEE